MVRDEKIDKMAKIMGDARSLSCKYFSSCYDCPCDCYCGFRENAKILLEAGYDESTETALKIFNELERYFIDLNGNKAIYTNLFNELKEKYTNRKDTP